jgi:aspartokinase
LCEKEKTSSVRELLKKENIKFEEVANVATVSVVGEGIAHSLDFFERTVSFMDQSKMDCLIVVSNSVSITWAVESRFKTQLANFLHK